jgi:Flp pilus assembly protein TadD
MGKEKKKVNTAVVKKNTLTDKQLYWLFMILLAAATIGLYGITARNYYNLDDYHIAKNNPDFEKGIAAIPKIFTSLYATESGMSYGYRPLVRTTFAIEYQFFGKNPYASHVINTLLYLITIMVLFRVLRRLLKNYHIFFPFLVALLFLAHPVHTEVVASLKNRDEILMLMLCLISLDQFISYTQNSKNKHFIWGVVLYFLAFLAKLTATAFFLIIPLALYFFTEIDRKKLIRVTAGIAGFAVLAALGPFLYLPLIDRPLAYFENPLPFHDTFINRIAYGLFSLYFYLRLLIFPHPLRYYYGYNVFHDISFSNPWVIISLIFFLGIFIYAIWKFRQKHILSFAILVFFASIAMFLNTVKPVPGIIGERFLWVPSLGFAVALAYLFYKIFMASPKMQTVSNGKMTGIIALTVLIMIPYSGKTYLRNLDWQTDFSLMSADMPHLWDSFKANEQYANVIMDATNKELAKPVNVLKFLEPQINEALMHWERAIEIYPDHFSPYNNIGMVYSRVYKEQDTAITYFNQALERKPGDPMVLFNLGMAHEGKGEYARAIDYYQKSLSNDPEAINTRSRLANVYYGLGEFKEAVDLNQEIMQIAPNEALPYVNLGNYYIFQRDTVNGIRFYEKAVELGAPPEASIFLAKYYLTKGDIRKSNYFKKIADDLQKMN